jgi:hypothetical protein
MNNADSFVGLLLTPDSCLIFQKEVSTYVVIFVNFQTSCRYSSSNEEDTSFISKLDKILFYNPYVTEKLNFTGHICDGLDIITFNNSKASLGTFAILFVVASSRCSKCDKIMQSSNCLAKTFHLHNLLLTLLDFLASQLNTGKELVDLKDLQAIGNRLCNSKC